MNTGKIERIGYPSLVKFENNSKNKQNKKDENKKENKDKKQEETVEIPDEIRGKKFDVKL